LSFGKIIQRFLDENIGDQLRLEEMQRRFDEDGNLYNSDVLYLEKLTELDDNPVVFSEEPFVFEKQTKVKDVKKIVKQTVNLTTKQRIPLKLIIIPFSIVLVLGLAFLALHFNLYYVPDVFFVEGIRDLFFTNILLPICDMELYWNPCGIIY